MCVGMLRHKHGKLQHCTVLRRVSCCSCRSSCRNTPTRYWTPTVCVTWVGGYVGVSDGYSDIALDSDALEVTEHRRVHRRFRWTLRHSSVLRRWYVGGSGRSLRCKSEGPSEVRTQRSDRLSEHSDTVSEYSDVSLTQSNGYMFESALRGMIPSQRPFLVEKPI